MYVSLQRIRSHAFIYKQRWLFSNKSCLKSFTFWKKLNEVSQTSAEFYSKVLYKSKVCKDFSTKSCPRFCTGIHCSCELKLGGGEEIFIPVFDLWISCRLCFYTFIDHWHEIWEEQSFIWLFLIYIRYFQLPSSSL